MKTKIRSRVSSVHAAMSVLLLAFFLSGCSSGGGVNANQRPNNLETVYTAYMTATQQMKRPPQNKDELQKYLPKETSLDKIMKSEIDNQEYVVVWGFNPFSAPTNTLQGVVFAYERDGESGKRWVATTMGGVTEMTEDQFKKATFPPGHNP